MCWFEAVNHAVEMASCKLVSFCVTDNCTGESRIDTAVKQERASVSLCFLHFPLRAWYRVCRGLSDAMEKSILVSIL